MSAAWCPQCGPRRETDEDGCCLSCGSDAIGDGAEAAWAVLEALESVLEQPNPRDSDLARFENRALALTKARAAIAKARGGQ